MISHQRRAALLTMVTAFTVFLSFDSPVQAGGNSWGWKKPINQRMGAFYTSNKAFKRTKSSSSSYHRSSRYRHTSSYPTYTVKPVHPVQTSRVVIVKPATEAVTVTPASPAPQPISVPPQPASAPVVKPAPVAAPVAPVPAAPATVAPEAKPTPPQPISVEQRALQLLGE